LPLCAVPVPVFLGNSLEEKGWLLGKPSHTQLPANHRPVTSPPTLSQAEAISEVNEGTKAKLPSRLSVCPADTGTGLPWAGGFHYPGPVH
jgi:hypothetical protein